MIRPLIKKLKQTFDLKALFLCLVIVGLFVPIEFSRAATMEYKDSDGDGFVDMQEYAYGTSFIKADSDNDGLSDSEEIFEFGTSPLEKNSSIFDAGKDIRFLFPVTGDKVRGHIVFFKGVSKYPDTSIFFTLNIGGKSVRREIPTDGRGIFLFEENLEERCSFGSNFDVTVTYLDKEILKTHITCEDISSLSFLDDAKFQGKAVADIFGSVKMVSVPRGSAPVFFAHIDSGLSVLGVFQSTIFSSGIFVDDEKVPVIFRPAVNLENGPHEFTLVIRDPKLGEVYTPLHIPFVVEGDKRSFLSSVVVYSSGGLFFGTVFGLMGGVLARVVKKHKKRKGIK